ncbi:MAG TPA: YciI family protein [Caulobacteraceae bacterium]|jgi:hypothetical protein
MARFLLLCLDKPDSLALRMANREAHLAYVAAHPDKTPAAGPLLDDEGKMKGSLLIVEAEDRAAVEAFSAGDPYRQAGLFERVEIHAWRQSVGTPI